MIRIFQLRYIGGFTSAKWIDIEEIPLDATDFPLDAAC